MRLKELPGTEANGLVLFLAKERRRDEGRKEGCDQVSGGANTEARY